MKSLSIIFRVLIGLIVCQVVGRITQVQCMPVASDLQNKLKILRTSLTDVKGRTTTLKEKLQILKEKLASTATSTMSMEGIDATKYTQLQSEYERQVAELQKLGKTHPKFAAIKTYLDRQLNDFFVIEVRLSMLTDPSDMKIVQDYLTEIDRLQNETNQEFSKKPVPLPRPKTGLGKAVTRPEEVTTPLSDDEPMKKGSGKKIARKREKVEKPEAKQKVTPKTEKKDVVDPDKPKLTFLEEMALGKKLKKADVSTEKVSVQPAEKPGGLLGVLSQSLDKRRLGIGGGEDFKMRPDESTEKYKARLEELVKLSDDPENKRRKDETDKAYVERLIREQEEWD